MTNALYFGAADAHAAAVTAGTFADRGQLSGLMNSMQAADVAPTANILAAVNGARATAARVMAKWNALRNIELPALNAQLKAAGLGQKPPVFAVRATARQALEEGGFRLQPEGCRWR